MCGPLWLGHPAPTRAGLGVAAGANGDLRCHGPDTGRGDFGAGASKKKRDPDAANFPTPDYWRQLYRYFWLEHKLGPDAVGRLTWPQALYVMKCDRESRNASGREEFNSVQEAFEAIEFENKWELIDGR
jgi:hypothetical protein